VTDPWLSFAWNRQDYLVDVDAIH